MYCLLLYCLILGIQATPVWQWTLTGTPYAPPPPPPSNQGVANNSRKTIFRNRTIVTFAMGTRKLYDYVDKNPFVEFHPATLTNNIDVIAKNYKMTSINTGIEVDISGQVGFGGLGFRL